MKSRVSRFGYNQWVTESQEEISSFSQQITARNRKEKRLDIGMQFNYIISVDNINSKARGFTMRKITERVVDAFINNEAITKSNTKVYLTDDFVVMSLFGNDIARKNRLTGVIELNNCGWDSVTTKERLNGIISKVRGYSDTIHQVNYQWYWRDGEAFPYGKWVTL